MAPDPGLSEVVRFLAQRPPFDTLAAEELSEVAAQATIEFHLAGAVILTEDQGPVTFLRVIHSGAVDVTHEGRLLDLLGPGDAFGHAAMLSGLPPGFEARAAQDTLCYRIPATVARPLLERARRRELEVGSATGGEPVSKLLRTPTVTCKPSESIGIVAERMTAAGATSAVVELDNAAIGIVTDRDLRARALAAGLSRGARIDAVMTAPAYVVSPDAIGAEVLYEMLRRGIRHAPVVSERGRLIGVLEDSDVFAGQPRSWFGARRSIERARNLDELAAVSQRLPTLMLELHQSNVASVELARVLTALVDALTCRAIDLAHNGGEVPTEGVVWVALGSQARRELTLASRPRGAIVFSQAPPDQWLTELGPALQRCGINGPLRADDAEGWTRAAAEDELALSVLADRRPLWGTQVEPLPVVDGLARDRLLEVLASDAFTASAPTGFDADSVLRLDGQRSDQLNIRQAAIIPIAALGRWAAAAADSDEASTPDRLRAAAAEGVLRDSQAATLAEAFEFALELRIVHQLEQLEASLPPDDLLDPAAMSPLTRSYLRDVFRAVGAVVRDLQR